MLLLVIDWGLFTIDSLIFSKDLTLTRVRVGMESILGTLGARQEYTIDGAPGHQSEPCITHLGGKWGMSWEVGANWRIRRKSIWTQEEHEKLPTDKIPLGTRIKPGTLELWSSMSTCMNSCLNYRHIELVQNFMLAQGRAIC